MDDTNPHGRRITAKKMKKSKTNWNSTSVHVVTVPVIKILVFPPLEWQQGARLIIQIYQVLQVLFAGELK